VFGAGLVVGALLLVDRRECVAGAGFAGAVAELASKFEEG
jgi:hypothetical protein